MAPENPKKTDDIKTVVVDYARQELTDPLKPLGKWVGFGVGGAVLWGLGISLIALGVLRAMQTETGDTFSGNLSFVPYLVALALVGVIGGLTFVRKIKD